MGACIVMDKSSLCWLAGTVFAVCALISACVVVANGELNEHEAAARGLMKIHPELTHDEAWGLTRPDPSPRMIYIQQ